MVKRVCIGVSVGWRGWIARMAALSLLAAAAGCGGGGGISLIAINPTTAQALDAGQTLTITASVVNDPTKSGASFSISGPGSIGAESVSHVGDSTVVVITYAAPATVAATTSVTVTATATNTPTATASVTITLNPALTLTPATLPNGQVGVAYSGTLASTGGSGTRTFSVTSGALPAGLGLNASTGAITGSPSAYGTFTFSLGVTDSASTAATLSQSYTLTIAPQTPTVTTATLPNGVSTVPYGPTGTGVQLTYTGGNAAATVSWAETGPLPPGLSLSTSGLIAGTPTNAAAGQAYNFAVTVTVGTQTSQAVSLSITVPALPTVATTTLPNGNVGVPYGQQTVQPYGQQLSYTGGNGGTVSWAIVAGSLPSASGLTLSSSGLISGTPTSSTTYNFSVAVTVGPQTSAPQALTLVVNSLIITTPSTANGEFGLPFSFQLGAAGGTGPYTWQLVGGSNPLPANLTLTTAGLISGAPAGTGNTTISVQAIDTKGASATQNLTIAIAAARSNASNSLLSGQYAFLLSGFDVNGKPLAAAGKFTADGNGNITGGVMDTNGTGLAAATTGATLSATTYSVGPDNRGKLTLSSPAGTLTFVLTLDNVGTAPVVAAGGFLTEFDGTGQTLTGQLELQTPSAFTTASIAGGYAFGAQGFAVNSTAAAPVHRAAAGEIQFNGTGGASSSSVLLSSAFVPAPALPTNIILNVLSTGRGTLAITLPNGGGTLNFAVYIVSTGKFFLLSVSPASGSVNTHDLLYGQARAQTIANGSFAAASLNGATVFHTEALSGSPATPDVKLGLYTFNGVSVVTVSGDENTGGVDKSLNQTGTYTVQPTGLVAMNLNATTGSGGCANCVSPYTYAYLVGAGQGFLMDFTGSSGLLEPQTATAFSAASFGTSYALGTYTPLGAATPYITGEAVSGGTGTVTGTTDQSSGQTLTPDATLSASYAVANNGRTPWTPASGDNLVLYIVSPTKAAALDTSTSVPAYVEFVH